MTIRAYDPEAGAGELAGKIEIGENGYDILEGADGLVIFTDWQEFRTPDFELITSKMKKVTLRSLVCSERGKVDSIGYGSCRLYRFAFV